MATLNNTQRKNIKWGVRKLKKMAIDPTKNDAIIDTMAGKSQRQVHVGFCPTITKSRFLSTNETARLQGFKNLIFEKNIQKPQEGELVGNAMSFPVLRWVIKHAVQAAELL